MPFGLTNATAAFKHLMNNVFLDLLDICILVYLDDILIYSDTLEEHRRHIHEVLLQLQNNKHYAGGDKCSFHEDTVKYLGFILLPNGLSMDPSKVSTILEWPEPRKVKDTQSFLGFANFYRRFISDYLKITALCYYYSLTCLIYSPPCQQLHQNTNPIMKKLELFEIFIHIISYHPFLIFNFYSIFFDFILWYFKFILLFSICSCSQPFSTRPLLSWAAGSMT